MASVVPGRPPITDFAGAEAIHRSKLLIEEWLSSHVGCTSTIEAFLPTRVLDLRSSTAEDLIKFHVSGPNEAEPYCALSYCWQVSMHPRKDALDRSANSLRGGPQPLTLSTITLEALKAGISISKLPQTFRDAVEITRKLSVRYLWIDSLCILQDSALDMRAEIGRMSMIYKHARVTIAASSASAVSEGFLSPRRGTRVSIPFLTPEGKFGKVQLRLYPYELSRDQPLNQRGWALQEFLLSPRLLEFGNHDLLWHGQEKTYHSITGGYVHYHDTWKRLPTSIFTAARNIGQVADNGTLWTNVVRNYSQRHLTFSADKPYAIAGIVNKLQDVWKDACIHRL